MLEEKLWSMSRDVGLVFMVIKQMWRLYGKRWIQCCGTNTLMVIIWDNAKNNLHLVDETIDMHGKEWKRTVINANSFLIGALIIGVYITCIMIFFQLSLDYICI